MMEVSHSHPNVCTVNYFSMERLYHFTFLIEHAFYLRMNQSESRIDFGSML